MFKINFALYTLYKSCYTISYDIILYAKTLHYIESYFEWYIQSYFMSYIIYIYHILFHT